ncbi:MAG: tubulin-like doman-containing protein [Eggerthellales bacterium]|nr:tubulin-like doman-containing protein [Eggerthellales bacterium]
MAAPTLIVGVGGTGANIVGRVMDLVGDDRRANVAFVVFDTDANDLRLLKESHPSLKTIQTSPQMTVEECIASYEGMDEWFPSHPVLNPKDLTQGAGQVRAISRLAFETVLVDGKIEPLHEAIKSLHGISGDDMAQAVRIVICGTIAGGTGSGLLLPLGLYLRNYFKNEYHKNSVIIRGMFILPDVLTSTVIRNDERQRRFLEANAYATVREIDAFMRKGDGFNIDEGYSAVSADIPIPGTTRRETYPPLLPYDFIFMTDAQNFDGKTLDDKETYYDYIALCIYAQSLTPVGSRSNSAEDNLIRETIRSNGRSRYCGAGVSKIVYPFEDVRDYVAFGWAQKNIADEWLKVDQDYEAELRECEMRGQEAPSKDQFYVSQVNQLARGNRFFEKILRQTKRVYKGSDSMDTVESNADLYIRALTDDITSRLMADRKFSSALDDVQSTENINVEQEPGSIIRCAGDYYGAAIDLQKVADEVRNILPYNIASSLFGSLDAEKRLERPRESDIETWLVDEKGNSLHPAAARYVLYEVKQKLEEKRNEVTNLYKSSRAEIDEFLSDDHFDLEETPEKEGFSQRVEILAKGSAVSAKWYQGMTKKITSLAKKKNEAVVGGESLQDLFAEVADFCENVETYYINSSLAYVIEEASKFITSILDSYDLFYGQISRQAALLEQRRVNIADNPAYNATGKDGNKILSSAVRYVCADRECLERIDRQAICATNAANIPGEVCQKIYIAVMRFNELKRNRLSAGASEGEANSKASVYFTEAFEEAILDYWRKSLLEGAYSHLVDMDIIDAMRAEGVYRENLDSNDELNRYAEDVFREGDILAVPMIENPRGFQPRVIKSCLYSSGLSTAGDANKVRFVQHVFGNYNGIEDGNCPKTEILVYKSVYGMRANQIPKFIPVGSLNAGAQGGNYYKSYMDLIGQLGPESSKNKELTPHLDVRWHWPFSFPNLDEDEERRQKNRIVRAFIYGLVFGKITMRSAVPRDIYQLELELDVEGDRGTTLHDFVVSNGTPCDYFWEVFDGLNVNPPFVNALTAASEKSLTFEAQLSHTSPENCRLVYHLGSEAFGDATKKSQFVLKEFGPERRSIFEIPLLYKISAPMNAAPISYARDILIAVFDVVGNYFSAFVPEVDLDGVLADFFEEQYRLFERNLAVLNVNGYPGIYREAFINEIRAEVKHWFRYAERIALNRSDEFAELVNHYISVWEEN